MTLEDLMEAMQRVNLAAEQLLGKSNKKSPHTIQCLTAKTKNRSHRAIRRASKMTLEDLMKVPIKEAINDMSVGKVQAISDDEGKVLKIIIEYVPKERSY